ncbi:MAG TPA: hypothetical protein VJN96_10860 [Vicinamibacterales bacterium]|nr:hypothetical protein [Vicinamibacterales bacterium]
MAPTEEPTNRYAPYFSLAGYLVYFVCGGLGAAMPNETFGQALSWQLASGGALTANVIAGIWLARRGEDLAAAGFTMLGIVYGVYFASIVVEHIDMRLAVAGVFLMIPAQILITFCRLFPIWVKVAGVIVCLCFAGEYVAVITESSHVRGWQTSSYLFAEILAVIWGVCFVRGARREAA